MCSTDCAQNHLKMPECPIIAKNLPKLADNSGKVDYQAIMPLRCLLMKKTNPQIWEYCQMFQDHCNDRILTQSWEEDKKNIVLQIQKKWNLQSEFSSAEEILRIEGILDVNTLELLTKNPEISKNTPRAFYPITSFAAHDCVNNTFHTFNTQWVEHQEQKVKKSPIN
jgi:hypothetical protein